jgi:hypothetical protein
MKTTNLPRLIAIIMVLMLLSSACDRVMGGLGSPNPTTTRQPTPASNPQPRAGASISYDPAHHQIILFGGQRDLLRNLDDTWTWDGTSWTEQHPRHRPPARQLAGLVYDAARSRTVLFGGSDADAFNDTWLWDGTDWEGAAPCDEPFPESHGTNNLRRSSSESCALWRTGSRHPGPRRD